VEAGLRTKAPFKIHLKDEQIMSVAGIWDTWRRGTPHERCSFSILKTAANSFMSEIHDRMPVILGRSDEDAWLDPEIRNQSAIFAREHGNWIDLRSSPSFSTEIFPC
jgi:putative SOS response-associated peptidase YedK